MKEIKIGMMVKFTNKAGEVHLAKVREINGNEIMIQTRKGYGPKLIVSADKINN